MPSIAFTDVAWSTPEGRPLFSHLHLGFGDACRVGLVGGNGVGKTTLLRLATGELQPQSGSVSVNATLGFLRQTVQVRPGETVAGLFGVAEAWALLQKAERGEAGVEELAEVERPSRPGCGPTTGRCSSPATTGRCSSPATTRRS